MVSLLLRFLFVVGLTVTGAVLGGAIGLAVSVGFMEVSKLTAPDDPSARSVGIIAIILVPIGCLAGGFAGLSKGLSDFAPHLLCPRVKNLTSDSKSRFPEESEQ
jgi:hypothetical protein